jgi:hypothetical protein
VSSKPSGWHRPPAGDFGVAPKTVAQRGRLWFLRITSNQGSLLTKSGATPDLTGATPVPPF